MTSPPNAPETDVSQGHSFVRGVVVEVLGGVYQVRTESGVVEATLRGRLKQQARVGDRVVVGDEVGVGRGDRGDPVVEHVFPRRTQVVRRTLGGRRSKVVAANLDNLIIVCAAKDPVPVPALLDRLLVIGESGGLQCHIVFTKSDLLSDQEREDLQALAELYRSVGYSVLVTSPITGEGMDECERLLCSGSSALVGPSGVGKSTLVNAIQPGISLRTAEVGKRSRAGRHTTVSARFIDLDCGGVVADTPGFSDAGLWGVESGGLAQHFPEFRPYLDGCRFRDCSHVHEPGCEVLEAVEAEEINPSRYETYRALQEEVSTS